MLDVLRLKTKEGFARKNLVASLQSFLVFLAISGFLFASPSTIFGVSRLGLFFDVLPKNITTVTAEDILGAIGDKAFINVEFALGIPFPIVTPSVFIGAFFKPAASFLEMSTSVYAGVGGTTDAFSGLFLDTSVGFIFNDKSAPYSFKKGNLNHITQARCSLPVYGSASIGYEFLGENFPISQSIMVTWFGTFQAPFCDKPLSEETHMIGIRYDISL